MGLQLAKKARLPLDPSQLPVGLPRFSPGWRWLGSLLARLYGLAQWIFHRGYDWGWWPAFTCTVPVISIGGIEVGGSGKTPVTIWLINYLQQQGYRVGLLSRGYGRITKHHVLVQVLQEHTSLLIGDEPALIMERAPGVVVACGKDRIRGAKALVAAGCQVIVMDDGFAHRRLQRVLDIVVLRAKSPLGATGQLLPLGTLREPPGNLQRADLLWWHDKSSLPSTARPAETPQGLVAVRCDVRSQLVCSAARCLQTAQVMQLAGVRVVVACGVAWPQDVLQLALTLGAEVVGYRFYADHYRYDDQAIGELQHLASSHGACAVVMTEKDGVKLRACWPSSGIPIWTLPLDLLLTQGEQLLQTAIATRLATLLPTTK